MEILQISNFDSMKFLLPLLITLLLFSSCTNAKTGPTLEDGSDGGKQGEIQFEMAPDVDYRAQGPFSEGPSAPPNVPIQ